MPSWGLQHSVKLVCAGHAPTPHSTDFPPSKTFPMKMLATERAGREGWEPGCVKLMTVCVGPCKAACDLPCREMLLTHHVARQQKLQSLAANGDDTMRQTEQNDIHLLFVLTEESIDANNVLSVHG